MKNPAIVGEAHQPQPRLTIEGTVDRWVDGDTVDVKITEIIRVRLKDVNTPELSTGDPGKHATMAANSAAPVGSEVTVDVDLRDRNRLFSSLSFGRVVGDLYCKGLNVGKQLVRTGFATSTEE